MLIEFSTDSDVWLQLKHAIRATGRRYHFQQNLFDSNRVTLFLEELPEPEGGELRNGLIVYDGGSGAAHGFSMDSKVFEVYQQETEAYQFPNNPVVKPTTNVASASTVCVTCGCRLGRGQVNTKNCQCNCHGTDRRPEGVAS